MPQDSTAATSVHSQVSSRRSHSKSNIEGLLLYHPLIVQHPWEPPKDLDRLIDDLIAERETYIVQRAYNPWDHNDANKARAQIDEIKGSLKPLLLRIYAYTSNAFHVRLRWLIPRADANTYSHESRVCEWSTSYGDVNGKKESAALPFQLLLMRKNYHIRLRILWHLFNSSMWTPMTTLHTLPGTEY